MIQPDHTVAAYILAGGGSRRFGTDKGLYPYRGKSLVMHVVERLQKAGCTSPVLVGAARGYASLALPMVPDVLAAQGAAMGILSALAHLRQQTATGMAVIVACDMPWLDPALVELQVEFLTRKQDACACIPRLDGRWTATHGVYRLTAQKSVREFVDSGRRRLQTLVETLQPVDPVTLSEFPVDRWRQSVRSANCPEDLTD